MIKLPSVPLRSAVLIGVALGAAVAGATVLTPRLAYVENPPSLEATVPHKFGQWTEVASPYVQVDLTTRRDGEPSMDRPYDQTVMRTYRNAHGHQVMLALAYGERQQQEVKVHRPDLCYIAQGYKVESLVPTPFEEARAATGDAILGKRMVASSRGRTEAVAYWIRVGHVYSESAWDTRLHILKEGLNGRVPDGVLVRASSVVDGATEANAAFPLLESFLAEMINATPATTTALLVR